MPHVTKLYYLAFIVGILDIKLSNSCEMLMTSRSMKEVNIRKWTFISPRDIWASIIQQK